MTYANHRDTDPDHTSVVRPFAIPHIRHVGLERPWVWLSEGWSDFSRAPMVSLSYGLAMVAVSYMLVLGLSSIGLFYLVLPLVAGFMLMGPIVAVGLYEVSRLHGEGRPAGLMDAFGAYGRNAGQIAGSTTRRKMAKGRAPSVIAACSSVGSRSSSTGWIARTTKGIEVKVIARITPPSV